MKALYVFTRQVQDRRNLNYNKNRTVVHRHWHSNAHNEGKPKGRVPREGGANVSGFEMDGTLPIDMQGNALYVCGWPIDGRHSIDTRFLNRRRNDNWF